MKVETYLFFNGKCEEALTFYQQLLGIEVSMLMRYKESPDQSMCPPNSDEKIMHANFKIGETALMASDGDSEDQPNFQGFSLSFDVPNKAEGERVINGLAEGGKITMPLAPSFWGGLFGMVTDKYGISWMVSVLEEEQT